MYKRWLSQALEHAAFPLVILAVVVSLVESDHHSAPSLLQDRRESFELRQSVLNGYSPRLRFARSPKWSRQAAEGSPLNMESNQND